MGNVEWILGMRVLRIRNNVNNHYELSLDQKPMVIKILEKFNMVNCKHYATPESGVKLTVRQAPEPEGPIDGNRKYYQTLTGALLYLALSTRPDIAHAVNILSRFLSSPSNEHIQAAKRVLRYLAGTSNMGLAYTSKTSPNNDEIIITAYSDADWAGDLDDRKSTTGYVILLNGNLINWSSKKQATVALSTAEAEYMAISAVVQELKWLTYLLNEMKLKVKLPITLFCDNQAAVSISENDVHHHRTKHIDIRHHYIRDEVRNKFIQIKWIQSTDQLADIMTKGLTNSVQFQRIRNQLMKTQE